MWEEEKKLMFDERRRKRERRQEKKVKVESFGKEKNCVRHGSGRECNS